jgi:hypothetical protein
MCHLFLRVAKLYIQAKTQDTAATEKSRSTSQSNQPAYYTPADGNNLLDLDATARFDPYLSALGLMPNSAWPMAGNMQNPDQDQNQNLPQGSGDAYDASQGMGAFGAEGFDMNFAPPLTGQNAVQDWFSGSRYLMNLMEAGDDLLMADINDVGV